MGDAARVSHEPFLERGVVGDPSQSQVKIAKTPKQGGSRTSLMFSCEDFYVDSTSVLKDSRHPSHTHLNTPTGGSVTHRVVSITMFFENMDNDNVQVNLNRTHSSATTSEITKRKTSGRQRFYSESTALRRGSSMKSGVGPNLSRNSSFCRQNSRSRGSKI